MRFLIVVAIAACAPASDGGVPVRIGPIALAAVVGQAPAPPAGDPAWEPLQEGVSLQRSSVYWLRAPVELLAAPDPSRPVGVKVAMLAALGRLRREHKQYEQRVRITRW